MESLMKKIVAPEPPVRRTPLKLRALFAIDLDERDVFGESGGRGWLNTFRDELRQRFARVDLDVHGRRPAEGKAQARGEVRSASLNLRAFLTVPFIAADYVAAAEDQLFLEEVRRKIAGHFQTVTLTLCERRERGTDEQGG